MTRTSALGLLCALSCCFATGCECGSRETIATLARLSRTVERSAESASWTKASIGDRFSLGDAVRTGPSSSADLEVAQGSGLRLAERTTVRFSRTAASRRGLRLAVETGQVEVESQAEELWIETDLGAVRIDPSSRVRLTGGGGIRVEVMTGAALLDPVEGANRPLAAGASADIGATGTGTTPAGSVDGGVIVPRAPDGGAPSTGVAIHLRAGAGQVREAGQDEFRALAGGANRVAPGTVLRLEGGARASVRRGGEEAALTGPAEVVVAPSGASLLRASHGSTSATATSSDVRVEVPGGSIILKHGGSRARVAVGRTSTEITPERGNVAVDTATEDVSLVPGQRALLTREGAVEVSGVATEAADVAIGAGESPIIHDPGAPTAVRVGFGAGCPGPGTLEVTGRRRVEPIAGSQAAVVRLALGVWQYRVRCTGPDGSPGEVTAQGSITVRGDTGATPPAKRVAHNVLDADGRNYTVLYQNLLPSITLRWSDAPPGGGFTLQVQAVGGRGRVVRTAAASHTFASGEIAEGRYQFSFQAASGVRSPTTSLRLGFDNAAPAATLRDVEGATSGGVRVQGLVEPGWEVSVDGAAVPLDGHNRFNADLVPAGGARAVAIRLEKAGRGVHYYVRRPAAAAP